MDLDTLFGDLDAFELMILAGKIQIFRVRKESYFVVFHSSRNNVAIKLIFCDDDEAVCECIYNVIIYMHIGLALATLTCGTHLEFICQCVVKEEQRHCFAFSHH